MSSLEIDNVFAEIESAAAKNALSPRQANVLRLLAEEMFSMTTNLADNADCSFCVWNSKKQFELRLRAKAKISPESKKNFISVSSKKENVLAKGLLGKIRSAMDDYLFDDHKDDYLLFYPDAMNVYEYVWSLNEYMKNTPPETQKEDWDGLERSILINVADDIIIGVDSGQVEMTVKKTLE